MRWPWRCNGKRVEPLKAVNLKRAQPETTKEILAGAFQAKPEDKEDMIQSKLEGRFMVIEQKLLSKY